MLLFIVLFKIAITIDILLEVTDHNDIASLITSCQNRTLFSRGDLVISYSNFIKELDQYGVFILISILLSITCPLFAVF
jgi:hypothetical protein